MHKKRIQNYNYSFTSFKLSQFKGKFSSNDKIQPCLKNPHLPLKYIVLNARKSHKACGMWIVELGACQNLSTSRFGTSFSSKFAHTHTQQTLVCKTFIWWILLFSKIVSF